MGWGSRVGRAEGVRPSRRIDPVASCDSTRNFGALRKTMLLMSRRLFFQVVHGLVRDDLAAPETKPVDER